MKAYLIAAAALLSTAASAQSVSDDVHCVVLSGAFAANGSTDNAKQIAGRTMAFYVGRLDGRGNPQAIKSQIQATKIDPKTASAGMVACANRMNQAGRALLPGPAAPTGGR